MVGRIADAAPPLAITTRDDFPDEFDHVEPGDLGHRPLAPPRDQIALHDDLNFTEGTQLLRMLFQERFGDRSERVLTSTGLLAPLGVAFLPGVHAGLESLANLVGAVTCLRQLHVGIDAERKTDRVFQPRQPPHHDERAHPLVGHADAETGDLGVPHSVTGALRGRLQVVQREDGQLFPGAGLLARLPRLGRFRNMGRFLCCQVVPLVGRSPPYPGATPGQRPECVRTRYRS
jgi:hypothetical protein